MDEKVATIEGEIIDNRIAQQNNTLRRRVSGAVFFTALFF